LPPPRPSLLERHGRRMARFRWAVIPLFVLLLVLVLRLGDLALQWPALLIPVAWALIALRPRRGEPAVERRRPSPREGRPPAPDRRPPAPERRPEPLHRWDDDPYEEDEPEWRRPPEQPGRRPPPTLEMPWLPEPPRDRREE